MKFSALHAFLLLIPLLGLTTTSRTYNSYYRRGSSKSYTRQLPRHYYRGWNPQKNKADGITKAAAKPNIVFILADDLGWNDVSWNNPDVITPNLQSLAENGVILNQSYVQAICSPSRAAYLTGMYPYRIGFQGGVVQNGRAQFLPLNLTLLPEKLKERGYSTHLVGKWHLGHCRVEATPTLRGFDSFFGYYSGVIDYFTKRLPDQPAPNFPRTLPDAYDLRENLDVFFSPRTEYTTDLFTDRAVDIIEEHDTSSPLYLTLSYTTPHFPLQVPERFLDFYPDVTDPARRRYLAMVTSMDEGIGRVIQALKARQIFDNTVIIFTSDNGALEGAAGGSNFPLRGQKGDYFEGGVRAPTFVHSPNLISRPGRVSEDLFHIVDWFPTLLEAAGQKHSGRGLDGKSQWKMLTKGTRGRRNEFVYTIADAFGGIYALRRRQFKLIEGNPVNPLTVGEETPPLLDCAVPPPCNCRLYDIEADPTESNDLVCQRPLIVRRLFRRLTQLKEGQVPSIVDFFNSPFVPESAPEFNNGTVNFGWC